MGIKIDYIDCMHGNYEKRKPLNTRKSSKTPSVVRDKHHNQSTRHGNAMVTAWLRPKWWITSVPHLVYLNGLLSSSSSFVLVGKRAVSVEGGERGVGVGVWCSLSRREQWQTRQYIKKMTECRDHGKFIWHFSHKFSLSRAEIARV